MTGEGTIVSVNGETAVVRIFKSSACSHNCADCGVCQNPSFDTVVKNPIGAKEGDKVLISSDSGKILLISLLVYILPVFLMILAAVFCDTVNAGAFGTLITFIILVSLWIITIRKVNKNSHTEHTIIQIIKDWYIWKELTL